MHERVVVVGGGVGGLATALALGRAGHRVTIVERDVLPSEPDVEGAFATERSGAPQAHQTHGFLARVVVELREHFPDVLDDLLAAGCTTMPATADLGEPQPGDEDLRVLIVRRTTFEWVLRKAVLAQDGVEIRAGTGVAGLSGTSGTVDGVLLDDGTRLAADFVVASTGRRGDVAAWLQAVGVDVPEKVHESGLMYLTRWYRLPDELAREIDPKLGGDLGFVKYLGVPGDGGTLSVTLAIRPGDSDLRGALSKTEGFELACRLLPGPDQFFRHGPLEPIGDVRPMGGLLNRLRRFTDQSGTPTVLGFHAVGDAHTCTNPLYGRGCSLALVQATLLADAVAAHPGDALARARAYEAASVLQVEPWFHSSVEMDKAGADPTGLGSDGERSAQGKAMAAVFVAAQTDPLLARAIGRLFNLLVTPAELVADPAVALRMAEVMADPDAHPVPPPEGPTRAELLEALAA